MSNNQVENISIKKVDLDSIAEMADQVAVEEPLEISVCYSTATGKMEKKIAVTMRTPGNDEELAAGFLFTEGVIKTGEQIKEIKHNISDSNRLMVILTENTTPFLNKADRNFYTTSSCGVCGKASIDAIITSPAYQNEKDSIVINAQTLYQLQDESRKQQEIFENTGGIHAACLFTLDGQFKMLREDVGRHNALDKLIGVAVIKNELPLANAILLLSGRASFELIQKASMAGIRIIAAVGAPSSLAVEMAKESGITLVGFLRSNRFNIYSGEQRIRL